MEEKNELFQNLQSVRNIQCPLFYKSGTFYLEKQSQRQKVKTDTFLQGHLVMWMYFEMVLVSHSLVSRIGHRRKCLAVQPLRLLVVAKRVLCQFSLQCEMTVAAEIFSASLSFLDKARILYIARHQITLISFRNTKQPPKESHQNVAGFLCCK